MAIEENHPAISPPKMNIILWRYMDIPSFVYLLAKESLTFVRADLFEDKFEGTFPKLTASMIDEDSRKEIEKGVLDKRYWNFSEMLNKDNKSMYLSCWCQENHEMVHMWKIYSKESGIAIQTTYNDLKNSILTKEGVYPTQINYIDFKTDFLDWKNNTMTSYTIKRKEYKSESEFRMLISHPRIIEDKLLLLKTSGEISTERERLYLKTPIINCEVDIKKLISKVHLSPYAPKWYYEVVTELLNKYGLGSVKIIQSDL